MVEQPTGPRCWRCGNEVPFRLRVMPIPRTEDIPWCIFCYIEVNSRFYGDTHPEYVTVDVHVGVLLSAAARANFPITTDDGTRVLARFLERIGWRINPTANLLADDEMAVLCRWWPRLVDYLNENT